jgi:hypothetical protein
MATGLLGGEWELLRKVLPAGWREAAQKTRAIRREEGPLADPETLLRLVLGHAASDQSFRAVVAHAREAGLCDVSDVALFKREQKCGDWLEWIADAMMGQTLAELPATAMRLRLVDATCASKPGSTGTDFRLHVNVELPSRRFTSAELTDKRGGESLKRLVIKPGDLVVGDRAYGTAEGIVDAVERGGEVLVRVNASSLPMWNAQGVRLDPLELARSLRPEDLLDLPVEIRPSGATAITGRLCILALPEESALEAQRRVHRTKRKKQKRAGPRAVESAKYIFVFTTTSPAQISTSGLFAVYRLRWQIELAFKTIKTVLHFDELPNRRADTGRTWLLAKLVGALLLERVAHPTETAIFPSEETILAA